MTSSFFPRFSGQTTSMHGEALLYETPLATAPRQNGLATHPEATPPDAPHDAHLLIDVADWDLLFEAVETTLRRIVGERLDCPPEVPVHSAALSASLVQAVVLDCVGSLDRLHAALKQERSQRPTP